MEMESGSEINTEQTRKSDKWEILFRKYARIWIWSILFGSVTGLGFSYLGVRVDGRWGPVSLLPLILLLTGIFSTLGAWLRLFSYLKQVILPLLFEADYNLEEADSARVKRGATRDIAQAYQYLLLAGITRLLIAATELLFQTLFY